MASHTQRYISNDLSHFVGRDLLEDPQAQYERLKAILHEGELRRPRRLDEQEGTIYAVHVDAEGSISRNEMYFGTAVRNGPILTPLRRLKTDPPRAARRCPGGRRA